MKNWKLTMENGTKRAETIRRTEIESSKTNLVNRFNAGKFGEEYKTVEEMLEDNKRYYTMNYCCFIYIENSKELEEFKESIQNDENLTHNEKWELILNIANILKANDKKELGYL